MESELVTCLGHTNGCYMAFRINRRLLPNRGDFNKVLVAYEGRWTEERSMHFFAYKSFEEVQANLGKGLALVNKEFSPLLGRSLFLYDFVYDPSGEHILVVPANGEEFFFELYGVDRQGGLVLLLEMDF